ncbi:RNA polymerase sigma factor [Aliikangiella sp. IMCC44653]
MTDFEQLYSRYADDIFRFALFLSGRTSDAEDITAETFIRAMTGKAPLKSNTVKGYLLTIARNLYLEQLRQQKRLTALPQAEGSQSSNGESLFEQRQEIKNLYLFLQSVSETERSALLLRIDGLAYAEISQILRISIASAKVSVHRVRLKLARWRANQCD